MAYRIAVSAYDGRRFKSPLIDDGLTLEEAHERFTDYVLIGELPEWLLGQVEADELEAWTVIPGPRYTPPKTAPLRGAVKQKVAVWPDPAEGRYLATPVDGPLAGNLHAYGATEREALLAAAQMLDALRNRPLGVESSLAPEVLEALKTKPEEMPQVRYFMVEIERGNRFNFEPVESSDAGAR